jgi:hypothetical protein
MESILHKMPWFRAQRGQNRSKDDGFDYAYAQGNLVYRVHPILDF